MKITVVVANKSRVIGLISDTHGLLRPEAVRALRNSDLIIHAGDIGNAEVIDELQQLAPVVAVRGNNDNGEWALKIPEHKTVKIGDVSIYVIHDIKHLPTKFGNHQVVIYGHSHRPEVSRRNDILFMNPGSAGPRRFHLPVSLGQLRIKQSKVSAKLIELTV